jgi:formate hydrogenlyase transcriptional activator
VANPATGEVVGATGEVSPLRGQDALALVVEVSRSAANLDLPELIHKLGACLSAERRWDHVSLCLHEPAGPGLRAHLVFATPGPMAELARAYQDRLIPLEGTQSGRAFLTGQPCVVNSVSEYSRLFPTAVGAAVRATLPPAYASCAVPLSCRGKRLGNLAAATFREGAFDAAAVLLLSQIADVIAPAVDNALGYRQLEQLRRKLADDNGHLAQDLDGSVAGMVGGSSSLRQVLSHVAAVAPAGTTVLIHGETGTGKELVARAIHRLSGRRQHPFVTVNCAAIPSNLLESELFGHERGAYTGASTQKLGRFELAAGGTLFMDEVGELPLEVQPKLLRVLQEQELERVGGTRTVKVDARVVAATNRDLSKMIAEGAFRRDLYYRLNVFPIVISPLRERMEDLPQLARHFTESAARRLNRTIVDIHPESLALLGSHHWPGNVRELQNVIERAVILSSGPVLHIDRSELENHCGRQGRAPLPPSPEPTVDTTVPATPSTLEAAGRGFIIAALEACHWVVGGEGGAAQRLGLHRTTLQARMRKLGITRRR